jgi:hypothetical protein
MAIDVKRRTEEICVNGNVLDYQAEITLIVQAIIGEGCEICCNYVNDCSRLEQTLDDTRPNRIWISVRKVRATPIHIVWDIMHEFGHHRSGRPEREEVEDPVRRLRREEIAWDKALKQLEDFPTLKLGMADFLDYKDFCLFQYRKAAQNK